MSTMKLRQVLSAWLIAAMLLSTTAVLATPPVMAAPAAQVESQQVAGTLPGGEFAKIWLALTPETRGQNMTIKTTWDRNDPASNGVGFFVLDADGLRSVLSGSADVREANISAGSRLSPESPDNELGSVINATGEQYTIVLFNDSNSDANFTLSVENGMVSDDSDQVRDLTASPTPATDEDAAEGEGDDEMADDAETDAADEPAAEETPAPVAPTATPAATAAVTETAETEEATTDEDSMSDVVAEDGVVRAQELSGELPNQNDQHYLALEPSVRDGEVVLTLSFDPQDSSELARRLNFWVLDENGFNQFTDASQNVVLSQIAIAAGSSAPDLAANQRQARFTSSGFGPYTVVVYNNSNVPGTYTLRADGGVLIDDSNQTLTAQRAMTGTTTTATSDTDDEEDTAEETADTDTATTTTTTTATSGGREGTPGGTYTVQAGDTLSLIARDIYGEIGLWEELCAYNNLTDCNNIEVGQVLQLPTRDELGTGATAPATTTAPAATATETETPEAETPSASSDVTSTTESTVTSTNEVTGTTTVTDTEDAEATDEAGAEEEAAADEEAAEASVNLVAALEAAGSFDTLVQALTAAGLTDALEGAGPFTIFAPTDAAFANLPAGALDQLLAQPNGQLTQILLFHVLPGRVTSADLTDGMQATTQQGKAVSFEVDGDTVRVNGANVTVPDIAATNGVIHAIDAVILPPPD